jgi:hypothetical protein
LDGCLGVEARNVEIALADDLCDMGGIILIKALHDCGRWAVPLLNHTLAFAFPEEKYGRPQLRNPSRLKTPMVPDPGLDGTSGLIDVDLTTFSGHAAHARRLESQVIFHRPKETASSWGWAHRCDDVPGQQPEIRLKVVLM